MKRFGLGRCEDCGKRVPPGIGTCADCYAIALGDDEIYEDAEPEQNEPGADGGEVR